MKYNIAFIGYNEEQTRLGLDSLVRDNADQVVFYDRRRGVVKLLDGTTIYRVQGFPEFLYGRRFDQAIVADDRRRLVYSVRWPVLHELDRCMAGSVVPEELRWCFYNLDAEVTP